MSTFECTVIEMPKFGKLPSSDFLSITQVFGVNVIFKTGDFEVGEKVVYIPEDSMLPLSDPRFSFLSDNLNKTHYRLRAKRLRGIYSEGLLIKSQPEWEIGQNVADILGIKKHEDQLPQAYIGGQQERDPGFMPVYDVENYLKYKNALQENEEIVATEKIHGTNFRCGWKDGEFFVGSHNCVKRRNEENLYWKIALREQLDEKLKDDNKFVLYGEIFGQVQDLKYGAKEGEQFFRAFDVYDANRRCFLDYFDFVKFCSDRGIDIVPQLYLGQYDHEKLSEIKSGNTTIENAKNIREGIVIKPVKERRDMRIGRIILKWVSEEYKLRKGGTEAH